MGFRVIIFEFGGAKYQHGINKILTYKIVIFYIKNKIKTDLHIVMYYSSLFLLFFIILYHVFFFLSKDQVEPTHANISEFE